MHQPGAAAACHHLTALIGHGVFEFDDPLRRPRFAGALRDDLGMRLQRVSAGGDVHDAVGILGREGQAVLVAGSDSPTAPFWELATAIRDFQGERRALIGACEQGGYYAIGLTTMELGILRDISWSTGDAVAQTRERCRELGLALRELSMGYEIDLPESVERLRIELAAHPGRAPRTAAFLRENPP